MEEYQIINIILVEDKTHRKICCIVIKSSVFCYEKNIKKLITKNIINKIINNQSPYELSFKTEFENDESLLVPEIISLVLSWFGGSVLKYDKKRINLR